MIHTKEIRWFFEQENSQILNWFEAQGLNEYQVHEDIYLNLGKEDIGIKLREGRVEIKHRVGNRAKGYLTQKAWGVLRNVKNGTFL